MKQVDSAVKELRANLVGSPWLFSVTFSVTLPHRSQQGSSPSRAAAWLGPTPASWAGSLPSGHSPTPVGPQASCETGGCRESALGGTYGFCVNKITPSLESSNFHSSFFAHFCTTWEAEVMFGVSQSWGTTQATWGEIFTFRGHFLRKLHSHYVNSCSQSH